MTSDSIDKAIKLVELADYAGQTLSEGQISTSENLHNRTRIRTTSGAEILINDETIPQINNNNNSTNSNNTNSNNNNPTFVNLKDSGELMSNIGAIDSLKGVGSQTITSDDERKELMQQNKNYTPQLSQNIFKNIIPTTKQIKLNKQWTNRHNNFSTPRFEEKYHGINPYPLVKINTPLREQIILFCNFSHVLHPNGVFRRYWNGFILILLIYTCLMIPLTVAFEFDLNFNKTSSFGYKLAAAGLFIDIMLIIDVLLNFRTSYKDDNIKSYIRDENQIAWHYAFSYGFYFDIITSLPLELLLYKAISNSSRVFSTIKTIEFIRLIKILRIVKAVQRFNMQTEHVDGWKRKCLDMTFVVYIMVFTAHAVACGWWWVGVYSKEIHKVHPQHYLIDNTTVITYKKDNVTIKHINGTLIEDIWWGQGLIDLNEDDFPRKYIISFYWAVVTLLTTGYGDITPSTTQEMFFVTMVVFVGTVLFGWIVGRVTELLLGEDLRNQMVTERIESAKIFCKSIGLDKHQTRNVIDYVSYYSNHNYLGDVNDILVTLPPDIRLSVLRQEKLKKVRGSLNNYNMSEHCESSYRNQTIKVGDTNSKNIFKNIYNYFSTKSSGTNNNLNESLRVSSVLNLPGDTAQEKHSPSDSQDSLEKDINDLLEENEVLLEESNVNALKSSKIDHIPYVLLTKILFGDNRKIQDDEEFFNILSLKIKKMTIKEGELFTRSDQIETTLFITLNKCVVRYSYNPIINFSNDDWIAYLLPPYTILGNLHSKYDVDVSIQCYQDNGCLVYVLEKEDISAQLKLLDYRLEDHEMEKVYNKLIKTNYHGLVIPYNQILTQKLLKSKVSCKLLRKNEFTAKTIKRRKHFSKDTFKSYTKEDMHKEYMQQKKEQKSDDDSDGNDNKSPPKPKEIDIKVQNNNKLEINKNDSNNINLKHNRTSTIGDNVVNSNILKSIKKYKKQKKKRRVKDFNDRELLLHISKTLSVLSHKIIRIQKHIGLNENHYNIINSIHNKHNDSHSSDEHLFNADDENSSDSDESDSDNKFEMNNLQQMLDLNPNNNSKSRNQDSVNTQLLDDVIDQIGNLQE